MTRDEFIQREILALATVYEKMGRLTPAQRIERAIDMVDALEKSGAATWTNNMSGDQWATRNNKWWPIFNALLAVERAARSLREPAGCDEAATSSMNDALARLDDIRKPSVDVVHVSCVVRMSFPEGERRPFPNDMVYAIIATGDVTTRYQENHVYVGRVSPEPDVFSQGDGWSALVHMGAAQ